MTRTSSVSLVVSMIEKRVVEAVDDPGARRRRRQHLDVERIVADRDALDARLAAVVLVDELAGAGVEDPELVAPAAA